MKLNKMKTKKLKSYITIKQRITATFMVVVLLLQICIPTVALAATAWGSQAEFNRQLQMQLNSGLFSAVELAEANEAYKAAFYVYQDAQKADNLLDFYRSYNCVTGSPVIKQIGDTFVQTRLIRSQIKALMGRFIIQESIAPLTVYEAEAERINSLYKSGIAYGKKTCDDKLPMGSPLAENTSVAVDMIWPEVRTVTINNVAVSVLVPVVYLSQATLDRRVDGHQINFLGDTTFAGITLNSGVLLNGYNNTITGINGIINNGGKIASGGDLTLFSSGTIANLGGVFSATDNLKIVAEDFYNKTLVIPYKDKNGEGTRIGEIARVEAEEENLYIYANNDITFEGAGGYAGNQLLLKAGNNINIVPKQTNGNNQSQDGHWKVNKSTTDLLMSRLAAEDTLSLIAGGLINITASELISTQGGIELLAGQGIHILDELEQTSIQKEDRKGKTTGTSSEFRTEAVRAILKAGKGVLLDSEHGDVVLRATQLTSASGAEVYAKNGKVHLLMTKELEEFHLQTVRKSTWTIKTRTEDIIHENNIQNAIVGGLQVQAMYGINVEYTGKEGATLKEQIEEYRKMPEMKWMADLYDQAVVSGGQNVNWEVMEEVHKELKKTKKNLSPAAMAIIAIAVAVVTGGAGLGMAGAIQAAVVNATVGTLGATAAAALGAAMAAGAVALTTQAAQSLAAGNNLSETLSAMDSNESLKSLAVAMATAGAMSAAQLDMFKVPEGSPVGMANLARQAGQVVVNSTVSAGISVTINGGNSDDYLNAFKINMTTNAVNMLGEKMANKIKALSSGPTPKFGEALRYVAHAGLGCALGVATGNINDSEADVGTNCSTGAAGGMIGEYIAETYTEAMMTPQQKELEAWLESHGVISEQKFEQLSQSQKDAYFELAKKNPVSVAEIKRLKDTGVDLAKFTAALSAFAAGVDVNVAATTAENAAKNNATLLAGVVAAIGVLLMTYTIYDTLDQINEKWGEYKTLNSQSEKDQFLIEAAQELGVDFAINVALSYSGLKLIDFLYDQAKNKPALRGLLSRVYDKDIAGIDSEMAGHKNTLNGYVDIYTSRLDLRSIIKNSNIALKEGWDADRIYDEVLSVSKADRPNPSAYLPAQYIAAHLAKFDSGVIRISGKTDFSERGLFYSGNEGFVIPKSEFDRIFNETDGDWAMIGRKLGVSGTFSKETHMIFSFDRKDIPDLSMATGREAPEYSFWGANQFWIPGGKTNSGVIEAVAKIPTNTPFKEIKLN